MQTTGPGWPAPWIFLGIADGDVSLDVEHRDAALNLAQQSVSVKKDTVLPSLAVTTAETYINLDNQGAFALEGSCSEENQDVAVSLDGVELARAPCGGAAWSFTLDLSDAAIMEGTVSLSLSHSDDLANAQVVAHALTKDITRPTLAFASDLAAINAANKGTYRVRGTCGEPGVVSVTVGTVNPLTANADCPADTWETDELDLSSDTDFPDGTISFSASMIDTAGNASDTDATATVEKSTEDRAVAITSAPDVTVANSASYLVSGNL